MHKLEEKEKIEGLSPFYITNAENDKILLEIQGNHYQEVKNSINELHLIDTPETDLNNGLSYKIEDETLILNGSVESTYALVITTQSNIVDLIKAGEEWTLSAYGENLPELNTFVRITTANNTNALNILLNSETTEGYASISFNENSTTLRIMLSANAVYNNSKIKIKLEKGGTKTDYDKYCKMPSIYTPSEIATVKDNIKIIQCNSNFLKKQEETEITGQGLTGTVSNDGTITLNGTTTGATYIQLTDELKITDYYTSQNYVKHLLPVGNYKFISETSGQVSANDIHAYIYGSSSATRPNILRISESPKKEITFEVTNNENYYAYVWIKRGTTLTNFTMKFMLKRADDNSDYVQNEQKEYNLPIQQEMLDGDYFDLENNKEIHKWKKVILNGTENWQQSTVSNSVFFLNFADITTDTNKFKLLSNQYEYLGNVDYAGKMKNNKIYGYIVSGNLLKRIILRNDNFTTLDSFKASLAEKNMTLYYVASTTTELDLTEEQKQVLNNIKTFRGVNNIFFDNPIAKAKITYTIELSNEIKQQFIQGPVYAKVKLNNKTFFNKVEGTSSIYIPDAEADKITMEIRGNHYQEVRNSINELHLIDKEETDLGNGLSYKIEDETLILNGSVGSTYALVITTQSNIVDLIKAGEEWTLSAYGENLPELNTFVRITTANNTNALNILLNSETTEGYASISFNENSTTLRIMLSANAVYNNSKIKIKLEKGGTKTDYDKYCKMPSIYTPSEIATVKDNIKIIQCNSNFLKKQEETEITGQGLTGTVSNDGTITLNGTTTGATYIQLTDELKITDYYTSQNYVKHLLPVGNYKFISETSGQVSANDIHAYIYGSSSATRPNILRISESPKKEITFEVTNNENYYAYVWIKRGTTLTNFTMKFMLKRADDNSDYVQNEQKEYNLPIQQEMLDGDYFDLENNKEIHKWGYINTKNVTNLAVSLNTSNKDFRRYSVDLKINNRKSGEYLKMLCTHFKYTDSRWHKYEGICGWESGQTFCIGTFNKELDTAEKMKNYLLNNDVEIYYELAEQEELALTEEQKEVLDNMTTFKGINNIYFDNPLVNATVTYLPEIILTEADYIKSIKFYDTRFVPEKGIFGQTVMKQVDLEINNENQQLLLEDQEFELYLSTYYNEKEYNIKYGTFIVQKAEEENTNDNNEATCFDYMTKANQKYIDQVSYPCTMRELAENICEQLGLTLQTEKFRNDDFIVEDNQFVENETYRDVLKAIAMSAFSWARIDEHNVLRFDFNHNVEPIEELDYDQYYNLNKNEKMYGPVNKVVIGDSQIKGENVAVEDTESIATNGVHEVTILNNPFAYTQEKRIQLIEAGKELFGFTYLPINSMNTIGFIWLDCTDKIELKNMQDEVANTFVFDHTIEYDGTTLDEIASQALTETETKYTYTPETLKKLQRTEIAVDKQNQTITGIVEQTDGLNTQMTKVEQRVDGITQTVTKMGEDLDGKITQTNSKIDQTAQSITLEVESVKEELDGKISQTNSKIDQTADSITAQVESVQKELDGKITETNSKIDQTAQSITSEVNNVKKDLDENYSTTEETDSKIEQTAENINLSVTESIENIQVGGTNLIPNSAPYDLDNYLINNSSTIELTLQDEETAPFGKCLRLRTLKQLDSSSSWGIYILPTTKVLEGNKEYCFSLWMRATANTQMTVGYTRGGQTKFNVTTNWQKFTYKFIALTPTGDSHGFWISFPSGTILGRQIFVHSMKLEEGNKITAWSPAPSDDVKGSQIISSINISKEDIAINSDKISLKGKEINLTSDNMEIKSTNFNVDKNGNMTCNNANMNDITIDNAILQGNTIWLRPEDENYADIRIYRPATPNYSRLAWYQLNLGYNNRETLAYNDGEYNFFRVANGNVQSVMEPEYISTPKLTQTSLEEIKKNIFIYNENALKIVLNSDIYTYNLKTEKDTDNKHIGFVIGDKYRTPKQIITKEGNAIELYSAIGILWKGMQEQQNQIEQMKKEIAELKKNK